MTQENLLDQSNDQPEIDQNKNYFEELVGENKKFKDPESLARGKYEADQYVNVLTRRLDELRSDHERLTADYNARAKLEEVLDQLVGKPQNSTNSENTQTANDSNNRPPVIDPKQIESLISSKLQEHELTKKQSDNYKFVVGKLQEQFGNNYKSVLAKRAGELGLSEDYINQTARAHPQVILELFPKQQTEEYQPPMRSDRRSDNFTPKGAEKRTWSYYQKMKRDNPNQYRDPKTAVQMQKDYIALGSAFEDGDFHSS